MPVALLIPGLVFFGAIVLLAMAQTMNVWGKSQTEAQQTFWGFIGDALTGKATVHAITKATRAAISRWAVPQLKPVTRWFAALNTLLVQVFRQQTANVEETASAVERLRSHTIPHVAEQKVAPVRARAKSAQHTADRARASSTSTHGQLVRFRATTRPQLAHATHAVDVAIPQQLGRIRTREEVLSRDQVKLRERTTSLEHGALRTFEWIRSHPLSAVTGVFAGAVSIALARLGFGFFRCRSWQRLGRRMTCGLGSLLETIVLDALDVLLITDLCQITTYMVRVAQSAPVQEVLDLIISGTDELLQCQGVDRPPALHVRGVALPPLTTWAELPS